MSTEADFLKKAQAAFVASTERLDARTLARLREARMQALAAAGSRVPLWRTRWALPAGAAALACAVVIAGVVWLNFGSRPGVPFAAPNTEDTAIVLSGDNLDMYANMDFYNWLQAEQQDTTRAASGGNSNG